MLVMALSRGLQHVKWFWGCWWWHYRGDYYEGTQYVNDWRRISKTNWRCQQKSIIECEAVRSRIWGWRHQSPGSQHGVPENLLAQINERGYKSRMKAEQMDHCLRDKKVVSENGVQWIGPYERYDEGGIPNQGGWLWDQQRDRGWTCFCVMDVACDM